MLYTTKRLALIFLMTFAVTIATAKAQVIDKPNFALATHPITTDQMSRSAHTLSLKLTLENQLEKGYFCASKDIFLQDLISGKKYKLNHAEGIPVCPDLYHFKWKGEKLHFTLYFPLPDSTVKYVNLVEQCDANCLSIYGLILDSQMNSLLNQGFEAYKHHNLSFALKCFESAINDNPSYPFGFIYIHVIKILLEQKNYAEAKRWYNKVLAASFPDKETILKQIDKLDTTHKLN
jgi:tetratricopeptide (TPR) repeat protein